MRGVIIDLKEVFQMYNNALPFFLFCLVFEIASQYQKA